MDNKTFNHDETETKWYKKHRKALIIGGVVIVGTAAVVVCALMKKKMVPTNEITDTVNVFSITTPQQPISEITDNLIKRTPPTAPVPVKAHIRKLPKGQCPSESKIKLAQSLGVNLPPHHTMVPEHLRYKNCA